MRRCSRSRACLPRRTAAGDPGRPETVPSTLRSSSLSLNTTLSGITDTQTVPPPTATSLAQPCSFVRAAILFSTGSIFVTTPLPGPTAQTAPSPKSSQRERVAKRRRTRPLSRIDACYVGPERQPQRAGAVCEPRADSFSRERETTLDLAGARVDSQQARTEILRHPHRSGGREKTRARRERELDDADELPRGQVDAKETLPSAEQDPGRASRDGDVRPPVADLEAHPEPHPLCHVTRACIDDVQRARSK